MYVKSIVVTWVSGSIVLLGCHYEKQGKDTHIKGAVLFALVDTLAAHSLGGFTVRVGFSMRKCRMCLATQEEIWTKVRTLFYHYVVCKQLKDNCVSIKYRKLLKIACSKWKPVKCFLNVPTSISYRVCTLCVKYNVHSPMGVCIFLAQENAKYRYVTIHTITFGLLILTQCL